MRIARHILSLAVIAIIALVYIATTQPVRSAIMDFTGSAIYKGKANGVAMACIVRWDSKILNDYFEVLKANDMRVTFFVTLDWAKNNEDMLTAMRKGGHEIALLGAEDNTAAALNEIKNANRFFSRHDGIKLYMAPNDSDSDWLSRVANSEGLRTVVSSIDVIVRTTKPDLLAERAEDMFPGAIVRFEPTKTMLNAIPMFNESLKNKGYPLMTVSELIAD